jgi:hypothetical protein
MAQCVRCGQSGPVMVNPPSPKAQEFRGWCKPCVMSELRSRHEAEQKLAREWLGGIFSKIFS